MKKIFDARGNGDGKICPSIVGGHQQSISDYTAIVLENRNDIPKENGSIDGKDVGGVLRSGCVHGYVCNGEKA